MHNYLKKILQEKRKEVAHLADDSHMLARLQPIIDGQFQEKYEAAFKNALTAPGLQVIAELKRQSPSKGTLADISDPVALAKCYQLAGAGAISVLTDHFGFNGSLDDLAAVSGAVSAPVLRKDFIINPLQIAQAIYYGASAVLLIVAVLQTDIKAFISACEHMGIDALVEVHNSTELNMAVDAGAQIIGVNNRDLENFTVDTNNALALRKHIPENIISIAESGIHSIDTARCYREANFDAVLIGEALVRSKTPESFIKEVMYG